ncbi:MAG: acyltransferase [Lachnospiraceae bacterium]|nr:acyltransferase [Lachnospiraceae bacterium]
MKRGRYQISYITNIKTVFLMLIILWHSSLPYEGNPFFTERASVTWNVAAFTGGLFNVTLISGYVFCSGYLYARSLKHKDRTVFMMIVERAERLLTPYYTYGIVLLVPVYTFLDINSFGRPVHSGLAEGYKTMLLGQFSDYLWFFWMLFWVALFFILISPLVKKNHPAAVFVITLAAAVCVDLFLADFPYFKISQTAPYLICYFEGALVYTYEDKIRTIGVNTKRIAMAVLFAILVLFVIFTPSFFGVYDIVRPIGALFDYFLFVLLDDNRVWARISGSKLYGFLKEYRMDLYLLHMPWSYVTFRLLKPYIENIPWLCITAGFLLTMATAYILAKLKILIISGIRKDSDG